MTGTRAAKDALFEGFAAVGKALSSGRRLEILDLLAQGERSVEEVAGELAQSVATASHHLRALAAAGIVRTRRSGTRIYYGLASEDVAQLWAAVRAVAADHVAEVERRARDYLGDREGLELVSREELGRLLEEGRVLVMDVRPSPEYEAGHIPGARSVPPDQLPLAVASVPRRVEVVAYCRGPYCVYADDAVRRLTARGVRAARLEDGFPEWKRSGMPVKTGKES